MDGAIPVPDVLPVPAPVGLLQFLLILTFVAHVVPMNLLLGGGLLTAVSHLLARNQSNHAQLARRVSELMPTVVAFTVTLGVAPLLFVQVLYGHLLYSSSILMAWWWFSVVPLVILGYYGVYLIRFRWEKLGCYRMVLAWSVAAVFAVIGFIYTNNFTLLQRPDTWLSIYLDNPTGGSLNVSDPSVYPRYLHVFLGAVAVAGVWFMLLGARGRSGDADGSRWLLRYGARVFTLATTANIIVGFWFLVAVPRRVMMVFMGENTLATGAFIVSLLFLLAAFGLIHVGARRTSPGAVFGGAGALLGVLASMAVMRQEMRQAYLEPFFRIEELQTAPQWEVFGLFAVTLLVGLGAVGWLVMTVLRASPSASTDS